MVHTVHMQDLQDDLLRTARQLDELCQGLDGHSRFLHRTTHLDDAKGVDAHARALRASAIVMKDLARSIHTKSVEG